MAQVGLIGHFKLNWIRRKKRYVMTHSGSCFCGAVEIEVTGYAETVLPMRDGLPKLKDFPAEFGGSGEAIAE